MAPRNGEKDSGLKKGFMGTMLMFLIVPKCCQKFTLDPVAATRSVEKNKIQLNKF